MVRTRTALAVVALVVAFGVAAGSLPAPGGAPAGGDGGGREPRSDAAGSGGDGAVETPVDDPVSRGTRDRLLGAVLVLAFAAAYALAPGRRRTVGVAAGVTVVAAASYAWLRPGTLGALTAVGGAASAAVAGPVGVALGGVLALAASALAWRRLRGGTMSARLDETGEGRAADDPAEASGTGGRPVDVHPAALEASDAVGRAWQRAAAAVSVSAPGARTPREFVRAAEDEPGDATAFERLTAVFERVRYGDADPDREAERARSLATRALADDGDDAADPSEGAGASERVDEDGGDGA